MSSRVILSENGAEDFKKVIPGMTEEDKISLRHWISVVERHGIEFAQSNPSFRDHELNGLWSGYRAASFGYSARVIYRVILFRVEIVEIEKITTNHDYRR